MWLSSNNFPFDLHHLNKWKQISRLRIRPRVLIDVSNRSTATNVLGLNLALPIAIAPTAMQKMANSDGEKGTVRGEPPFTKTLEIFACLYTVHLHGFFFLKQPLEI